MALTDADIAAMDASQARKAPKAYTDADVAAMDAAPAETRPLRNTGPDLAGQLNAPQQGDTDITGTSASDATNNAAGGTLKGYPGAPGDPVQEAQDFGRFALGGVAGEALGAVAATAGGRVATRAIDNAVRGAGQKLRTAVGQVSTPAKELFQEHPGLLKGPNADIAAKLKASREQVHAQREKLFEQADARRAAPKTPEPADSGGVPTAVGTEPTARVTNEYVGPEAEARIAEQAAKPSRNAPMPAPDENLTAKYPAREMPPAPASPKVGVPVKDVAAQMTKHAQELENGTMSEREVAAHILKGRDAFLKAHGEDGVIPAKELRRQMSDYQTAYDKTATNASNKASKALSKATGDALREHVADPALNDQIDALTEKLSVLTRFEKAVADKAGKAAAPGKAIKEGPGVIKTVMKSPITGTKAAGRGADRALSLLAKNIRSGAKPSSDEIQLALSEGVQAKHIHALLTNGDQN